LNSSPSEALRKSNNDFVRRALALLRGELPEAYFKICQAIAGKSLALTIDADRMFLRVTRFGIEFVTDTGDSDVRIESDRSTVLDTIDARLTLESAIRSGRLLVVGTREDLASCHEALLFFVRGAVRSPSFPALLEEYRWEATRLSARREEPV
jgi:hypothetical protein